MNKRNGMTILSKLSRQLSILVIALSATRRLGRLWAYTRLFAVTLLCVIVLAALLPALGPYAHYAPRLVPSRHLETVGVLLNGHGLLRVLLDEPHPTRSPTDGFEPDHARAGKQVEEGPARDRVAQDAE